MSDLIGRVVSHVDAPFSLAKFMARLVLELTLSHTCFYCFSCSASFSVFNLAFATSIIFLSRFSRGIIRV